jgi:hypothetical protein
MKNVLFWLYLIFILLFVLYIGALYKSEAEPIETIQESEVELVEVQECIKPQQETESSEIYSENDKILMARVVFAEARGECDEGQQAIAQVILNRVHSAVYPDTISEVINQQGQFVIGNRYTEKELKNIDCVLENGFDLPPDVMYFGTWQFRKGEAVKIGNHYFMR